MKNYVFCNRCLSGFGKIMFCASCDDAFLQCAPEYFCPGKGLKKRVYINGGGESGQMLFLSFFKKKLVKCRGIRLEGEVVFKGQRSSAGQSG